VSADFDSVLLDGDMTQWFHRLYSGLGISHCEAVWWDTWNDPPTEWNAVSVAYNNPYWQAWDAAFVLYYDFAAWPQGACCDPVTGVCELTLEYGCEAPRNWLGPGTACDPNPCPPVPIETTTWGAIRGTYR
jgi:hypothetical protein